MDKTPLKECPYCKEQIRLDATRCRYCQATLASKAGQQGTPDPEGKAIYIVDKGLLAFGKFAITILTMFAIIGVFLFGVDIKKAAEEAKDARFETESTLEELKSTNIKLTAAKDDLDKAKSDFSGYLKNAKEELQRELDTVADSYRRTLGYEQEIAVIRLRVESKGGDSKFTPDSAGIASGIGGQTSVSLIPPNSKAHVALVSQVKEISDTDLQRVARALHKQTKRRSKSSLEG